MECGGRILRLSVFKGSNCWCLPYHHVFYCYIMTQAETKRVAEKKKKKQKKIQFNYWTMFFCLIFQIKNCRQTWEWNCWQFLETWNICSDLPVLSQEKKNLYMYIFCNSVIGRLICENVCVCWWKIHVGWIFYILDSLLNIFKYY